MRFTRLMFTLALLFLTACFSSLVWAQGPPFQTDDPVPVDFQNFEFYVFGAVSSAPTEVDPAGPAFEFNWGALPRVQLHGVLPFGAIVPINQGNDAAPNAYGLVDAEVGVKLALLLEKPKRPQIGIFPMFELPTGSYTKGLGSERSGTKFHFGCRRTSVHGRWMGARVLF